MVLPHPIPFHSHQNRQSSYQPKPIITQQTLTPPASPKSANSSSFSFLGSMSPSSGGATDLSSRCRALARSYGEDSYKELSHTTGGSGGGSGASPPSPVIGHSHNFGPPPSPSTSFLSPLSPRASLPSTPDNGFLLEEISEEREDEAMVPLSTDQAKDDATLFTPVAPPSGGYNSQDELDSGMDGVRRSTSANSVRSLSSGSRKMRSPVKAAFNQGLSSLVVDVWLVDGELLVGPDMSSLALEDTLSELYLDPFLDLLAPPIDNGSRRSSLHRRRSSAASAFHYITPSSPFKLFLKLHSSPSTSFQYLLHALTPLHDASLLTSFCPNANLTTPGLVTIICSGDNDEEIPWANIKSLTPRYVFAELSWDQFVEGGEKVQKEVTPVVRAKWNKDTFAKGGEAWDGMTLMKEETTERLKEMVNAAHEKGLLIHFVDVPMFPSHARELIRLTLHDVGADLL